MLQVGLDLCEHITSHIFYFSPPGKREDPYLTEAGREAFDKMYKIYEGGLQMLSNTAVQSAPHVMLKEPELVNDVLNVLIGVVSSTFSFNQVIHKQKLYMCSCYADNVKL